MLFREFILLCVFLFGVVQGIRAYLKVENLNPSGFWIIGFFVLIGMGFHFFVKIIYLAIKLYNLPTAG